MQAALAGWWVGITLHRTLTTGQHRQKFGCRPCLSSLSFIQIYSIVGLLDLLDMLNFVLAFKACRDTRLDI